jgi:hypothetical protein
MIRWNLIKVSFQFQLLVPCNLWSSRTGYCREGWTRQKNTPRLQREADTHVRLKWRKFSWSPSWNVDELNFVAHFIDWNISRNSSTSFTERFWSICTASQNRYQRILFIRRTFLFVASRHANFSVFCLTCRSPRVCPVCLSRTLKKWPSRSVADRLTE